MNIEELNGRVMRLEEGRIAINPQAASYVVSVGDCDPVSPTMIKQTAAGANTLTYPSDANAKIPVGSIVGWLQYAAGTITHTPDGGVTLRSSSSLTSRAQYSSGTATKIGANEWLIEGDLT